MRAPAPLPLAVLWAAAATMFASAPIGDLTKRSLAGDDEEALCFIYTEGQPAQECFGIERRAAPQVTFSEASCAQAPAPTSVGLIAWALARRRCGRRRPA